MFTRKNFCLTDEEYETIESDIAAIEDKLADIEKQMIACATDAGKLNALSKEQQELETQLEEKMLRWEYLEELAERIR